MGYTDKYERDTYGIIDFWVHNNFDHSRFFDREISHHEMELARENQQMINRMGKIFKQTESKSADIPTILTEATSATHEFHDLLVHTMDRALKCDVIISTPTALIDHMIREAEETLRVFDIIETGAKIAPAEATIHENFFWLRQLSDHLIFITHYVDASNYEVHDQLRGMKTKLDNLFLQANALKTMFRRPRGEVTPILNNFNQMVIKEAKAQEALQLEFDDLIKACALVTTSPPDLMEHIAREAHHLWRNLEDEIVT